MRVKLKTSVSGPAGSWSPGIRDLPDELADEMLEAGFAELIEDQIEKGDPAGEDLQTSAKSNEADSGATAAQGEKSDPAVGSRQGGAQKGSHSGKGYFKRG
jgi:hypothetical protein